MGPVLDWLIRTSSHGLLAANRPELVALHVAADAFIAASYFAVFGGIVWFLSRRRELIRAHRLLAGLTGVFVLAGGFAYAIDALALWYPIYGLQAALKVVTAAGLLAIVTLTLPLLPGLASAPSASELAEANERLRREVAAHEATLRELESIQHDLEGRVGERTKELSLVKARYDIALRGSNVTVFAQDHNLRYTSINNPLFGHDVDAIVGQTDDDILDAESRVQLVPLKREVLATGLAKDGDIRIDESGAVRWYDVHIEPLPAVTGEIVGLAGAAVDVTERKQNEAHLRLLMRELSHRSRNLLAVIQAMARQAARHASSRQEFLEQFSARLQAMATSHDLLVQEDWYCASLSELMRRQLGPYLDHIDAPVSVDGPPVLLKPEAVQSLGLALHELTANAAKFGSLSVPQGRIAITWRLLQPDGKGLELSWAESEGPTVNGPARRGFGCLVVEENLSRALDADVNLEFAPTGVRCRIMIPATHLLRPR